MIRICCSGTPPQEAELSGTRADLVELRAAIQRFCKLKRPILEVAVDPSPGEGTLPGLRFVRTNSRVVVEVHGGRLLVSGRRDHLEQIALRLPCDARALSPARVDGPDLVDPASLALILRSREGDS
jgi:hypothetical protein